MIKEFNNIDEIQKYYDKKTNTYIFKEDNKYIDFIKFNFDLSIKSNIVCINLIGNNITAYNITAHNINAWDIYACDIKAYDIKVCDIKAYRISARDIGACDINSLSIVAANISYFAVCFAYSYIICKSINGRRENAKHFVLDGEIEIMEE